MSAIASDLREVNHALGSRLNALIAELGNWRRSIGWSAPPLIAFC